MKKYILLLFIIHSALFIHAQKKVYVRMIDTSGWGNNFADTASINALSLSLYDRLADTSAAVRSALVDTASAIRGALPALEESQAIIDTASAIRGALPALEESQAIIDTASAIRSTIAALPSDNIYTADGTISDAVRNVTLGSNDINFDANTLFIDGSADRVGIGTNAPTVNLHILTGNAGSSTEIFKVEEQYGYFAVREESAGARFLPTFEFKSTYSNATFGSGGGVLYGVVDSSNDVKGTNATVGGLTFAVKKSNNTPLSNSYPFLFSNYGSVYLICDATGKWGMGTKTPLSNFDVEGSVAIGASYSGNIAAPTNGLIVQGATGIGTSSVSTHQLNVVGTAGLSTGTAWTNTSDMRLKDVRGRYTAGLEAISRIDPIIFSYKENNPKGLPSDFVRTGYSAQQVQALIPMAVSEDEQGYLQLNTDPMIAAMINAIRELKEQNEALLSRIEKLEKN